MSDIILGLCKKCLEPVFDYLAAQPGYIYKFDDNLEDLRRDMGDLRAKRDDVVHRVDAEEIKGQQQLAEVERWLSNVKTIEINTNPLLAEASDVQQRLSTYGYCSNIISAYYCGKKIPKMLSEVKSVSSTEPFKAVTVPVTPPMIGEIIYVQQTFGPDAKLQSTWSCLMENHIRTLGLYGMGGVGKTTFLTRIHNKFVEFKDNFDVVIWIEVSKDVDIKKIQDEIGKRLGLYDENWSKNSQREKASDIRRVLRHTKPRFVLLLDDLWEEVSLAEIGIPVQEREYKVVFATRIKDVCENMEADESVEVECLAKESAWELFEQKAKCGRLNNEISVIAEKIAAKCCGLPLAVNVIGKSLSSTSVVGEWSLALSTLESSPSEWKGTEKGIFQVLKLSYDYLEKEDAECFRYCALFPDKIRKDELVEYWIAEGFIDEQGGRQRAKDRGYHIINTLVGASLLLEDRKSKQKVYMNGMIREMALWVVTKFEKGEKFVVKTGVGLSKLPKGEEVTKMSVMDNGIEHIGSDSGQARRRTLFLQNNKLVDIAGKFFVVMPALVVLDLSRNPSLTELPEEIKRLVALRYLNLSGTSIKYLPNGFGELRQLIHLDLESTPNLQSIKSVSALWRLQVLRFYGSKASFDRSLRKKLEHSNYIEFLTITVREVDDLKGFLGSKLVGKTQGLYLEGLEVSFTATLGEMASLGKLEMVNCDIVESETEWKGNERNQYSPSTSSNPITPSSTWLESLTSVVITSCKGLKDLTWLMIYAANLESLSIKDSPKLEELISKKKAADVNMVEPFRNLQVLDLDDLAQLESIYWRPLSFPSLRQVNITACPNLRKLPLNSTSVERIDDLRIEVEEAWLDGVEWESGAEERFRPFIHLVSVS